MQTTIIRDNLELVEAKTKKEPFNYLKWLADQTRLTYTDVSSIVVNIDGYFWVLGKTEEKGYVAARYAGNTADLGDRFFNIKEFSSAEGLEGFKQWFEAQRLTLPGYEGREAYDCYTYEAMETLITTPQRNGAKLPKKITAFIKSFKLRIAHSCDHAATHSSKKRLVEA